MSNADICWDAGGGRFICRVAGVCLERAWEVSVQREHETPGRTEDDTTEAGAYCLALANAEVTRGLVAVGRAQGRTGVDYYLGPADGTEDLETSVRLEVSGTDEGNLSTMKARLRQKLEQAGRVDSNLTGARDSGRLRHVAYRERRRTVRTSWADHHRESERLASEAEAAGDRATSRRARGLYAKAANLRYAALSFVGPQGADAGHNRVSAAALGTTPASFSRRPRRSSGFDLARSAGVRGRRATQLASGNLERDGATRGWIVLCARTSPRVG